MSCGEFNSAHFGAKIMFLRLLERILWGFSVCLLSVLKTRKCKQHLEVIFSYFGLFCSRKYFGILLFAY